jgi:3-deoxy-D-manno-octulosonic acid (KDO) 8-phosphate synthase
MWSAATVRRRETCRRSATLGQYNNLMVDANSLTVPKKEYIPVISSIGNINFI